MQALVCLSQKPAIDLWLLVLQVHKNSKAKKNGKLVPKSVGKKLAEPAEGLEGGRFCSPMHFCMASTISGKQDIIHKRCISVVARYANHEMEAMKQHVRPTLYTTGRLAVAVWQTFLPSFCSQKQACNQSKRQTTKAFAH